MRGRMSSWMVGALVTATALSSVACRVNTDDLKRWEQTEHGPDKLAAVLSHDKYELELRVEAAWSLVEMKKRGGQAVGLTRLIDELERMSVKDRHAIVEGLWKKLEPKVRAPVTKASEGKFLDSTVLYKDAAFALYSDDTLDFDPKTRESMTSAFTEWAVGKDSDPASTRLENFEARMDNGNQQFGAEQIIRKLGLPVAVKLPGLLSAPNALRSERLDAIARVVVDSKPAAGDTKASDQYDKARDELSTQLARILEQTLNGDYLKLVQPEIEKALAADPAGKKLLDNPAAKQAYFDKVREDRLSKIFPVLKQVGRKPIVSELLTIAANEKETKEHRALALAALDGNLDTVGSELMKQFLTIAKSGAADEVKHGAIQRIAAFPPEQAVRGLYELFDSPNWKVRYDGALTILNLMAKVGDKTKTSVHEFLSKLPTKSEEKSGLGEFGTYGSQLALLPKEMKAKADIDEALTSKSFGEQMTAFGWYLSNGVPADEAILQKYKEDKEPVPKCADTDECAWDKPGCPVPKPGAKPDDDPEYKPIVTVGDYVSYCVVPEIDRRAKAPK